MGSLGTSNKSVWHPSPTYHLKAPKGWLNDPCAPGYDPATGIYHLFYQWNPESCDWGNISWGHFTSTDGVRWTHANDGTHPVLTPDRPYDDKGIFTGCLVSSSSGSVGGGEPSSEQGILTVVYSSVTALPIHWTLPYTRNCAGLALATSVDGGRTWRKRDEVNPVLEGEPEGINVTGFRDPVLSAWPAMDAARGKGRGGEAEKQEEKSLYAMVSGGVVGEGPNAFVYSVSEDLTTWDYIGPLVDIRPDYQRPSHWTGDFGLNWECVNFMTLRDEGNSRSEAQMLIMGTEGGLKKHSSDENDDDTDPHYQWSMWMGGSLRRNAQGQVRLEPEFSGVFDHGCFYAANSYEHPVTGRRIVWGWIKEDELTLLEREAKGWSGYLSLQRELFLLSADNVVGTIGSRLEDMASFKIAGGDARRKTVQTMGIRPLRELQTLRQRKPFVWTAISTAQASGHLLNVPATAWELEAVINVRPGNAQRIGFDILHNSDGSHRTRVCFSPQSEEIGVDRSQSNDRSDIQKHSVSGPFTLLVLEDNNGRKEVERLRLRLFSDGDVLEIFANDRFALSTVVYADCTTCKGVSWFVESGGGDEAVFESISIWGDLASVQM